MQFPRFDRAAPRSAFRAARHCTGQACRILSNFGHAILPGLSRAGTQTVTAFAGAYVADRIVESLQASADNDMPATLALAGLTVVAGGSMVAWQAGRVLHGGRSLPGSIATLRCVLLVVAVAAPLAAALAQGTRNGAQAGLDTTTAVLRIYIAALVRDTVNEAVPRQLVVKLVDRDANGRLDRRQVLDRRSVPMMIGSVPPNMLFAAAADRWAGPLGLDATILAALLRGAYAFGNEMGRAAAASRDGHDGQVRVLRTRFALRLAGRNIVEEAALRSALALPAAGLRGIAGLLDDATASLVVNVLEYFASAAAEFRGPVMERFRILEEAREGSPRPGLDWEEDVACDEVRLHIGERVPDAQAGGALPAVQIHLPAGDPGPEVQIHLPPG